MNDMPTQSVFSKIRRHVAQQWPVEKWKSALTIAAVSGGPDSVAMLRVLQSLFAEFAPENQLVVAHINHKTQPENSDADAQFVQELADQLNLPCHVVELDSGNNVKSLSEDMLRKSRYQQLTRLAASLGARYIATAHNRDDQIETILFRIFRGTGIQGLSGIPRFRQIDEKVTVVRPLLSHSRAEIRELLKELGQDYRVDATNALSTYSRNYLRNEVIPIIKERFGATFENGILRLGSQAKEHQLLLDELCSSFDSAIHTTDEGIVIKRTAFADQSPVLVRHALVRAWVQLGWPLQDMTSTHWSRLSDLVCRETHLSPFVLPGDVRVELSGTLVTIRRQSNSDSIS